MRKYGPFINFTPIILGASPNKIRILTALHSHICISFPSTSVSVLHVQVLYLLLVRIWHILILKKVSNYEKAATFFVPQVIHQTPHMCPYFKPVKQIKAIFFAIIDYTL